MPMHYDHEFIPAADVAARPAAAAAAPGRDLRLRDQQDGRASGASSPTASSSSGRTPGAARCARSWCTSSSRERRFFAEFIGLAEPPVETLLPPGEAPGVAAYVDRLVALARPRLAALADGDEAFWLAEVPFFDVRRAAHLGVLAAGAPYGPPPRAGRCRAPPAGGPRAAHLRPHGGRLLDRRRPDHDPGRGAPTGDIMQQQRRVLPPRDARGTTWLTSRAAISSR